jgi:geranylgeranyl pyrophosphate synthase
MEYAAERMNYYKDKALKIINGFEINDSQQALSKLVEYMISREK